MSSRERAVVRGSARRRRQSKDRDPPNMSHVTPLRIVLLGKSVSENSCVGNFLLGRSAFDSEAPPDVVERVGGRLKDRHVTIINSPQLLQTNISDDQITQTVRECVSLSDPGPHVFILVLQYKDFTEEDVTRVKYVMKKFSEEAIKRTIVITTDEETDEGASVKTNELIHQFTAECGGGHVQLDNEIKRLISGASQQLEKILRENNEDFLSCELYYDAGETLVDEDQSRSFASLRTEEDPDDPDDVQTRKRSNSFDFNHPNMSLRRMVLVGRTGAGKSSSGNTILGRRVFRAAKGASSVTKECCKETGEVADHQLELVDCPGIFDTSLSEKELIKEMSQCINMTAPGPHAIILVIQPGPFTKEERLSVEKIRAVFGEEADKHTIILFTHGDKLTEGIEQTLSEAGQDLKQLIESCGGRYHVFDNTKMNDRKQVLEFLDKVNKMFHKNGDKYYTSDMFQHVEEMLKKKEEELRKEYIQIIEKLTATFNEEKTKLEKIIRQLKESGQEKDKRIKELEEKDRHFKESKRFYKQKCKNVRQEVEEIIVDENIPEISRKLQKLRL